MKIPFVDLKAQYKSIQKDIDTAIANVINETAFIGGKYVNEFEKKFAELYGVKHGISCANGTDSLYIIMKMLGIGTGDEVITVANSWISSSETITQVGAKPVFIDIDEVYYSMNEQLFEAAITKNTKAVIAVHLQGQMCAIDIIEEICNKYNIALIEDCAQSHFSEYQGIRAGVRGIAGSFSFYPGKNLGAYGDAGCIITNNDELAEQCKMYARHGALKKHEHKMEGINSRLDGLQAAILTAKLPYILDWTEKRIEIAHMYNNALQNIAQIVLPKVRAHSKHTFHLYVIRAERRDDLKQFLADHNIETAIHYPKALPNLDCYTYLRTSISDFSIATKYQNEILSLPIFPELTKEHIEFIALKIKEFYQ